jgi:hypothetical protein
MAQVYHALGLNMHQPLGNLIALHNSNERWETRQILWSRHIFSSTRQWPGCQARNKVHSVHPEMVDFVPRQGRTKVSTAGVAGLRRG